MHHLNIVSRCRYWFRLVFHNDVDSSNSFHFLPLYFGKLVQKWVAFNSPSHSYVLRGYYMTARRYKIFPWMLKKIFIIFFLECWYITWKIFHEFAALTLEIFFKPNISNTRHSVSSYIKHREENGNTTRSGLFLTNFEVFGIVMKHCDECLI